jgi:hypothetical protein
VIHHLKKNPKVMKITKDRVILMNLQNVGKENIKILMAKRRKK